MPESASQSTTYSWLFFALLTVACWGVYGIFLHKGALGMPGDPNARYKAFLFVGIAYFITAVLAPAAMLLYKGADWKFSGTLMNWSLWAGIAGAAGAFCVLLAFGAKGTPAAVMSIIFAGAPIVNGVVAITLERNWSNVKPAFLIGILVAAIGGYMVARYKPAPNQSHSPPVTANESIQAE